MDEAGPDADTDAEVDARGMLCPLPVLRLRKRLQTLAPGQVVRLLATDPAAVIDVPHFCAQSGHEMLAADPLPEGVTAYRVRAGRAGEGRAAAG